MWLIKIFSEVRFLFSNNFGNPIILMLLLRKPFKGSLKRNILNYIRRGKTLVYNVDHELDLYKTNP